MGYTVKDSHGSSLHSTIIKLSRIYYRRVNIEFTKILLSENQPKILNFLAGNEGKTIREIAENCNMEASRVSSIINEMETQNLIYRNKNAKDKRILTVFLTDKGMKAQKEVENIFYLVDAECFQGFSEDEKELTIELMNRLLENMVKEE